MLPSVPLNAGDMSRVEARSTNLSDARPTVTIVLLAYNRREQLRATLRRMTTGATERVDVIVVDNGSNDGTAAMVRSDFPDVQLVERARNCGVSGWNDGFALARGEWVLALDDDCHLPPDGLARAVAAAQEHDADLVSFGVVASSDPGFRFDRVYRTGLLAYWGCAVLIRRRVLSELGGYDPHIFVWANELEFMLRFFDRGYRHLHLPEVVAVHHKDDVGHERWRLRHYLRNRPYRLNARHFAYIAAKHFHARDAIEAFAALLAGSVRDALRVEGRALWASIETVRGFAAGLRRRDPLRSPVISRTYRRSFHSYASPWWFVRPPREIRRAGVRGVARALLRRPSGLPPSHLREEYLGRNARFYPDAAATLRFAPTSRPLAKSAQRAASDPVP
jgi:GT2 family glycosyltransferase